MKAIDVIRRHTIDTRRAKTISEWHVDGEPLVLYFGKVSVEDMEAVAERNPKNTFDRNLIMLVSKAQSEDGSPAFDFGDIPFLRKADFIIVQELINFMYETSYGSVEEAKEKNKKDPTSAPSST